MRLMTRSAALLLLALSSRIQAQAPQAGDVYEIRTSKESAQQGSDGSSGSSTDRDTIVARVIALRDGGLELEYDLPSYVTKQDRARTWQFPARVFKPANGPMQLLNRPEMEVRLDRWLKAGKLTRAACGRWIFTWNAFRIECDPQSVIPAIEQYEAWPDDLREGALYQKPGATGPAPLTKVQVPPPDTTYRVELNVDGDTVRRERAEADMVVGEIMRKPLTLETELRTHSAEAISGTIAVTFELRPAGTVRRRTAVTKLEIRGSDERAETQTTTEITEKRLISQASGKSHSSAR